MGFNYGERRPRNEDLMGNDFINYAIGNKDFQESNMGAIDTFWPIISKEIEKANKRLQDG